MSRALVLTRVYLMIVGRLSASKPLMCKKTCRVEISYGFDDRRHAQENCLKQRCHNISNARRFLPSRSAEASWSWNVTIVLCRYPCSGCICFLCKHCPENWCAPGRLWPCLCDVILKQIDLHPRGSILWRGGLTPVVQNLDRTSLFNQFAFDAWQLW